MRIAAIHAHPDDVEFLAAGTLALLRERDCEIFIATVSSGDKGSPDKTREETTATRFEEARRSASIIGAEYDCLGMRDFEIFDDDRCRRLVTEYLRKTRPDIVITASPGDYLTDHDMASILVRHACFFAPVRLYETGTAPPAEHIPALYYMDPIEGIDIHGNRIVPDFCVDISSTIQTKESMLTCHESQREWLRQHHGMDQYIQSMLEWSKTRGGEYGFQYGEGFRQYRGHAYPRENRLVELLPAEKIRM